MGSPSHVCHWISAAVVAVFGLCSVIYHRRQAEWFIRRHFLSPNDRETYERLFLSSGVAFLAIGLYLFLRLW